MFTPPDGPAKPQPAYFFTGPTSFFRESTDDQFGIVRCPECGCVKTEDLPGAAFKFLDLLDCECEEVTP